MYDCISVIKLLLLTSGDVELNPGPSSASESDSEAMTTKQMLEKILKEQSKTTQTLKQLTKNLKHVETTVANIQERINAIEADMSRLTKCEELLAECEGTCQSTSKQVQDMVEKIDDLENRSRRNNLVIYGVTEEAREDSKSLEQKVKKGIFKDILGIDVASIERIHRVGYPQSERQRPVVLRLYNFAEKNKILSCCNKLKGSDISISEDFSKTVRETRAKLWKSAAGDKAKGAKVSLVYDKIKIDGKLYVWDAEKNCRIEQTKLRAISQERLGTTAGKWQQSIKTLRIISLNARSVVNKFGLLESLILTHNPHVIVITETWLHAGVQDSEVVPSPYKLLRKDRGSRGGGVAIAIKKQR